MDKDKMISIINDAFETSTASGGYYIKGPGYYKNKGGYRNILWITVSKNRISIYCNPIDAMKLKLPFYEATYYSEMYSARVVVDINCEKDIDSVIDILKTLIDIRLMNEGLDRFYNIL